MVRQYIMICSILAFPFAADAQDATLALDLPTVLQLAGAQNLTIKEYEAKQELAVAEGIEAKEWWIPELTVGASMHKLNGATMNGDGRFFLDVDRQNFNAGLGANATWNFAEGPMLAKAAAIRADANERWTAAQRNIELLNVIETYHDLLAADRERAAYSALVEQADDVAQQLEALVNAGSGYVSDLLLAKSNAAHLRIAMMNALSERERLSGEMFKVLTLDPNVRIILVDTFLVPLSLVDEDAVLSDEALFALRPDVAAARLHLLSSEQEKKTNTTGLLLPELRAGYGGSYFGDVFSPLYPTNELNGTLQWRIPIASFTSGGALKRANAMIHLQQISLAHTESNATVEVQQAKQQVGIKRKQIEIATTSEGFAAQAFQQTIQRQEIGAVRPYEVLQAQEVYLQAQLDHIRSVIDFNKSQYRLKVAIGEKL